MASHFPEHAFAVDFFIQTSQGSVHRFALLSLISVNANSRPFCGLGLRRTLIARIGPQVRGKQVSLAIQGVNPQKRR
jgi:hypothetical protein